MTAMFVSMLRMTATYKLALPSSFRAALSFNGEFLYGCEESVFPESFTLGALTVLRLPCVKGAPRSGEGLSFVPLRQLR